MEKLVLVLLLLPFAQGETEMSCESDLFDVTCEGENEVIVVSKAYYGISNQQTECGAADGDERCIAQEARELVSERCSGKRSCEFRVSHHKIPQLDCPENPHNMLKVTYNCVNESSIIDICSASQSEFTLPLGGYLSSPQYPSVYPVATECLLTLPAQPGDEVLVKIFDLMIETHDATACMDYLLIEDDKRDSTDQFCKTMFTSGARMTVSRTVKGTLAFHFKSDSLYDSASRGFLMQYQIVHVGPRLSSSTPSTTTTQSVRTSAIARWKRPSTIIHPRTRPTDGSTPSAQTTPATTPKATPKSTVTTPAETTEVEDVTSSSDFMTPTSPKIKLRGSPYSTTVTSSSASVSYPITEPRSRSDQASDLSSVAMSTPTTTPAPTTTPTPTTPPTPSTKTTPKSTERTKSSTASSSFFSRSIFTPTPMSTNAPSTMAPPAHGKAPSSNGLTTQEKAAIIAVVLFIVIGVILIVILLLCLRCRKKKEDHKFKVSYRPESSIVTQSSRESTSSTVPLHLSFANMVYNYDIDSADIREGGTVVVDNQDAHMVDTENDLPPELLAKVANDQETGLSPQADNEYEEIALQAGVVTAAYTNSEQGIQATEDPKDIFIMDEEAQNRERRRQAAKCDEPPSEILYDCDLSAEESRRLNVLPEISMNNDLIVDEAHEQNMENTIRELEEDDSLGSSICTVEIHSDDNTNNNASLSDVSSDAFVDVISLEGWILDSTDL